MVSAHIWTKCQKSHLKYFLINYSATAGKNTAMQKQDTLYHTTDGDCGWGKKSGTHFLNIFSKICEKGASEWVSKFWNFLHKFTTFFPDFPKKGPYEVKKVPFPHPRTFIYKHDIIPFECLEPT